jgi:exonuclease III
MEEPWQLASWNVAGLCHPDRKYKVLNWVKTLRHPLSVLAIQELKTDKTPKVKERAPFLNDLQSKS